jgi:hypothetical protein
LALTFRLTRGVPLAQGDHDLWPGFFPAVIADDVPQRQHGVDVRPGPMHATALKPRLHDHAYAVAAFHLLFTLFERFMQQPAAHTHRGHPFVYLHQALIVFFIIMQQRHIFRFKAQRRWLDQHPELRLPIGLETIPDRSTLSRRYKALYLVLQDFITFLGQYAERNAAVRRLNLCSI